MGINLNTLRPEPCVEGFAISLTTNSWFCLGFSTTHVPNNLLNIVVIVRYSTPGGYSARAVHPIALGKVMSIAKMMKSEFDSENYSLSAIGGVETGGDAAEFILLGANTVQVKSTKNTVLGLIANTHNRAFVYFGPSSLFSGKNVLIQTHYIDVFFLCAFNLNTLTIYKLFTLSSTNCRCALVL